MRHLLRTGPAIAAIIALLSTGTAPLFAAAADNREHATLAATLDQIQATLGTPQEMHKRIETTRRDALPLLKSKDPKVVARAKRAILLADIANAPTQQKRHQLIKSLGVTADRRATESGTVLTISVGSRVVRQLAIPATPAATEAATTASGPSAETARDDCYDGPGPCATSEEMADALALNASITADMESMQSDIASATAEYEDFCSQYPEGCDADGLPFFVSGPSAGEERFGCWGDIANALLAAGATLGLVGGTSAAVESAMAAGGALSATTLTVLNAAAILTGLGALVLGGVSIYCIWRFVRERQPETAVLEGLLPRRINVS